MKFIAQSPMKEARKRANMTVERASEAINVNPRTLAKYENGEISIPRDALLRMADAYGDKTLLYRMLRDDPVARAVIPPVSTAEFPEAAVEAVLAIDELQELSKPIMRMVTTRCRDDWIDISDKIMKTTAALLSLVGAAQ